MPRITRAGLLALSLACAAALPSASSSAQGNADEAEVSFRLGGEAYTKGRLEEALAYFLASHRLAPNRNVAFNVARVYERLERFPEAYRWYESSREGEEDARTIAVIDEALARTGAHVSLIEVRSEPPGAKIFVDRVDLGSLGQTPKVLAIEPRTVRVILTHEGHRPAVVENVDARLGGRVAVEARLERVVGFVEIASEAPARVLLDGENGEELCVAPCTAAVAPGPHILHFHREGYAASPLQVTVAPEKTVKVGPRFVHRTGSIVVVAEEADALVEVDGVPRGFTPAVVPNVPVGERSVRVTLRGHHPYEQAVVVRENEQITLDRISLDPIREVTTASRASESLDDAASSVSVITGKEIEVFGYTTIAEALRGQRGVTISNDGVYSSIGIRGLGQPGDYGNRLLVLSDGAVLNDNVLWQSFTGYDGRMDLGDVGRIELVRGAGSVLYGTGAVSGVVNLLPRERVLDREGSVTVATQDGRVNRARADGMVRVGKSGTLSLSASGAYSPGHKSNLVIDGEGTQTVSRVEKFQGATSVGRLHVGDFTAQYFVTYRDQTVPVGAWGTLVGDTGTFVRDTRALLELRYEPRLSERLTLKTRAFGNFYDYLAEYAYDEPHPDPANESLARETIRGAWAGLEARMIYELAGRFRVTGGAEGQVHPLAELQGEFVGSTGATESYMDESQGYVLGAAYGLFEWKAAEWLRVSAGARLDYWSTFGASVNPRLSLVLKPTENDTLKLMGGRAFRAPSAYETLYNDGGVTQLPASWGGRRLGAESVYSGELEYVRRIGRDFRVLAAAHGQVLDNLVETLVATSVPDEPIYYANGGTRAYTVGGDVEIQRELRAGIMMMAQYGYLEARYIEGGPSGQSGRLPNVPKHFASARGIIPLGKSGASLGARATVEGKRLISSESGAETPIAVLTDVVVSGVVRAAHLRYSVGVYDLFDARGSVPVEPGFASRTMPRTGRTILVLLGLTY